jgi:hypothetical protein
MSVRRLYQREGLNNNLHRLYPPVHLSKSLWPLLILTLFLLLYLHPLPPFPTQKVPATPTFMHIPTRLVLSIPEPELQLIRPSAFHTVVLQNTLRDKRVWICPMVLPLEVDPHQPTQIENLIIYSISIALIQTRTVVLNLIHIRIHFLVAV